MQRVSLVKIEICFNNGSWQYDRMHQPKLHLSNAFWSVGLKARKLLIQWADSADTSL